MALSTHNLYQFCRSLAREKIFNVVGGLLKILTKRKRYGESSVIQRIKNSPDETSGEFLTAFLILLGVLIFA